VKSNLSTDIIGADLANTPSDTFTIWTTYDLPHGFQIGAGEQYVSSRFNATTTSRRQAPGYDVINAMLAYKVNDHLTFRVNGYNLANRTYIDQLGDGNFIPGPGRSVTVTATIKF